MSVHTSTVKRSTPNVNPVYADLRWPAQTGIGNVMTACLQRAPSTMSVRTLPLNGKIGSPLAPVSIATALRREREAGVFWSPGFVPPAWGARRSVVTVHDLTHLHFYTRLHRAYYDVLFRRMYRSCSAVVCVSEYTRSEFLAWSGMAPSRVHVVLNGVDPAFAQNDRTFNFDYQYVLYPGNRRGY